MGKFTKRFVAYLLMLAMCVGCVNEPVYATESIDLESMQVEIENGSWDGITTENV